MTATTKIHYTSIAGTIYQYGTFHSFTLQLKNLDTGKAQYYTAKSLLDRDVRMLRDAGERVYRQWWAAAQTLRLIASMTLPTPPAAIMTFPSIKLLPAYATAAVEAQSVTTEHVIRIDEMVSECKRCRETFKGDAALCPTCADKQVEIIIDPADQLRALNQQLDAMFTDICTNEAWKAKRKALLQQKSALEAQINSARPQVARGEYYYGMDILAVVKKFEAKYPDRTVTAITINSAYETEITDVKGVPVKMSGAVRPNTVWVGGK